MAMQVTNQISISDEEWEKVCRRQWNWESTPRCQGKNVFFDVWRRALEIPAFDLSTAPMVTADLVRERLRIDSEMRAELMNRPMYGIDPAKPGTDKSVIQAIPPNPSLAAPPMQPEPDRIWDLIVLAARASRYGE